jgi:predicted regulator of Ras-like GTPase activity (Roadblock/LC7/MglB family)
MLMDRILAELNKITGVVGSFVVAADGIIVASDYDTELNDELMGALTSSIINSTEKAVKKMEQGDLVSFIVETDTNKLFFNATRSGFLVCVAQPDANLGLIRVEIRAAAEKLNTALGLS